MKIPKKSDNKTDKFSNKQNFKISNTKINVVVKSQESNQEFPNLKGVFSFNHLLLKDIDYNNSFNVINSINSSVKTKTMHELNSYNPYRGLNSNQGFLLSIFPKIKERKSKNQNQTDSNLKAKVKTQKYSNFIISEKNTFRKDYSGKLPASIASNTKNVLKETKQKIKRIKQEEANIFSKLHKMKSLYESKYYDLANF